MENFQLIECWKQARRTQRRGGNRKELMPEEINIRDLFQTVSQLQRDNEHMAGSLAEMENRLRVAIKQELREKDLNQMELLENLAAQSKEQNAWSGNQRADKWVHQTGESTVQKPQKMAGTVSIVCQAGGKGTIR